MRTEWAALAASVMINMSFMSVLSPDSVLYQKRPGDAQRKLQREAQTLQFEFVETPAQLKAQRKPRRTRKISDRDSTSQDLTKDKAAAGDTPKTAAGLSDQLAQNQPRPAGSLQPSQETIPAKTEDKKESQDAEKEIEKETQEQTDPDFSIKKEEKKEKPPEKPEAMMSPVSPKAPAAQPSGAERIDIPEFSKIPSRGAKDHGITAFEATGTDMGAYTKNLKEKIGIQWLPYLMIHYPKDFKSADAKVSMVLNPQGELISATLISYRGSPLYAGHCMNAIAKASPFGAVPKEALVLTGKEEVEIVFEFHYL